MENKTQINTSFYNFEHEVYATFDVGAAEKYCEAIWINPDEFKNVIIYLEDLHDFMLFLVTVENLLVTAGLKRF